MSDNPSQVNGVSRYRQDITEKQVVDLLKRVDSLEKALIEARLERERLVSTTKEILEKEIEMKVNTRDRDIEELKFEVAKLSSRLTLFQGAQAIFTTIAAAIATLVGRP